MNWRPLLAILFAVVATASDGQVRPSPGVGDPRLQTIDYKRDQIVTIETAPGYQLLIELAPDEQIQSIAVGDSAAWSATPTKQGNRVYIKAMQAGVNSNMTVVTNSRFYGFDLVSSGGSGDQSPYKISFRYPDEARASVEEASLPDPGQIVGRYHLAGDRSLLPTWVVDDGHKTYIEWPRGRSLPAVFTIDEHGRESVGNGGMRADTFVIDDVSSKLLFRIDQRVARADRYLKPPRRK